MNTRIAGLLALLTAFGAVVLAFRGTEAVAGPLGGPPAEATPPRRHSTAGNTVNKPPATNTSSNVAGNFIGSPGDGYGIKRKQPKHRKIKH